MMVVRSYFRSCIKILSLLLVFGLAGITLVSYYIVHSYTGKRSYSIGWQDKVDGYRKILLENYGAQPVTFSTPDNIALSGLLIIRPQAQRTILMCHGYGMHKERMAFSWLPLFENDNICLFDYRAHGQSEGTKTTIGYYETQDVLAAVRFLEQHTHLKDFPIIGVGVSMGAASLMGAAAQGASFKGLIIDSVFRRLDEQIEKMFYGKTGLPAVPFVRFCHSLYAWVHGCWPSQTDVFTWARSVTVPMLIVHSTDDKLADAGIAQELFKLVSGPKKLWIVDKAAHASIVKLYPQQYRSQIAEFFKL